MTPTQLDALAERAIVSRDPLDIEAYGALVNQKAHLDELREAIKVLVDIADAYDENALDDDARKFWGTDDQHENKVDPTKIELFSGRGGRQLLTLEDCLKARRVVLRGLK